MARYFTFAELTTTSTGFKNVPNWDEIENLKTLADYLDCIRTSFGKPIRVNCAYRSKEVNAAVGGSKTSAHLQGLAADIKSWSGKSIDDISLLNVILNGVDLWNVDQVIVYTLDGTEKTAIKFIHLGWTKGVPRHQILYTK